MAREPEEWLPFDEPPPGLLEQFRRQRPVGPTLVTLALLALAIIVISPGRTSSQPNAAVSSAAPMGALLGFDPAIAYDAKRGQVVALNQAGQTWLWAGRSWSLANPPNSPPTGFEVAAWDPGIAQVLLVGVVGEASEFTYTYRWDGKTWSEVHPAVNPPDGALSMAYDPVARQMVLLVGLADRSGAIEVQTWIFDGQGWMRRPGLGASSLSVSTALGFEPATRTMLAVSTNFAGTATSTWRWDGTSWQALSTTHRPPASARMRMFNQPGSGRLLMLTEADTLFGSPTLAETWTWSGNDWTEHQPLGVGNVIPDAVTAAGDAVHGELWAFEEVPGVSPAAPRSLKAFRWNGGSWDGVNIVRVVR